MRTDAAYQRIARVDGSLKDPIPLGTHEDTTLALAHLQIEATLAVARATSELTDALEGIRQALGHLR